MTAGKKNPALCGVGLKLANARSTLKFVTPGNLMRYTTYLQFFWITRNIHYVNN